MIGSRHASTYGGEAARVLAIGVAQRAVVVSGMARGIDAIVHTAALDARGDTVGVLGNGFGVIYPAANRGLFERVLAIGVAQRAVVVSGMARGIDAIVHTAALDARGDTVGVLGNGFGVIYPAANRGLYERMVAHGCLITEHPPGERPHAGSFPQRNRIISGLAKALVVVEAARKSGAFVTVDWAGEQGRTVLAVPVPITSRTSDGCNTLIQQGAKPALTAADILEELGLAHGMREVGLAPSTPAPRVPPLDLNGLQLALWERMTPEPQHVDSLVVSARSRPAEVLGALTELELRGLVRQGPGMVFGLV